MFQFSSAPARIFEVEHPMKPGTQLHLLPPLLETVRRLDAAQTIAEIAVISCELLSRNQENEKIAAAELYTGVDYDRLRAFIVAYRSWLIEMKANDPN